MPDIGVPAAGQAERIAVGFARALRSAGMTVPPGNVPVFVEALSRLGIGRRGPVYWAGQATLVSRSEDRATYDRVFDAYWLNQLSPDRPAVARSATVTVDNAAGPDQSARGEPDEHVIAARYSPAEILRHRDFELLTAAEWAEAGRLIAALRMTTRTRRSRRLCHSRHPTSQLDLRRSVRSSICTGGELVQLAWRTRSVRPRRLVLLVDVSGSMDSYARALLRFAHAAMRTQGGIRTEAFTLGTRLTRLTRELSLRDPDSALASASGSVRDWSGGTRLGQCLAEFNDRWGARGMARGAVVVVFSDGWDRGDPEVLGLEMARLHRLAHRVIWVNPLKATPGFAPLARGMAAVLPWVDDFVPGHSVTALEQLAAVIAGRDASGQPPARHSRP